MTEPPRDPQSYLDALEAFNAAMDLPGVGVITQQRKDADVARLAELVGRHPDETRKILAEMGD